MEKKDLSAQFVIYGDSALQMFHWLTPFIEEAGYKWEALPKYDEMSRLIVGAKDIIT